MVKNLAEEMIQRPVDKNWSNQFVARHKHDLTSAYLKNIDNKQIKAEYAPMFKQFYDLAHDFCMFCACFIYQLLILLHSSKQTLRNTILPPKTCIIGTKKASS